MKLRKYSRFKFVLVLGIGAVVALVLCVQCVRTYWYTDAVLVPQQAEREAERQVGALTTAARSAGITEARALGPVLEHTLDSASDRVLWMRLLDTDSKVLAQGGDPQGTAKVPSQWWASLEKHESLGRIVDTSRGKALVTMLPLRLQRPPRFNEPHSAEPRSTQSGAAGPEFPTRPPGVHRPTAYLLELAIPLSAVAGAFEGLRQNLVVGVIASLTLLVALAIIGLRAPYYLRGRYLESELQLAKRVQSDLQPKPHSIWPGVQFAASAVAADHVGGDFYDIFEAGTGKIAVVLGDVSGKGVSAALLVSVLQGAIRSSTAAQHEQACVRINRMLCERTACERFATLFWGVFDSSTNTLRYVNAGHAAPMLVRSNKRRIERLDAGGPVLGLLPTAAYSAGIVELEPCDTLILYSDGINEATNQSDEEFGEDRIRTLIAEVRDTAPAQICEHLVQRVTAFAGAGVPSDDRTLMVVRFGQAEHMAVRDHGGIHAQAVA